jgi:hypothetical protein
MKRFCIIWLCLAAVCALVAGTAASASAATPEFVLKTGKSFPVAFDFTSGKGEILPKSPLLPITECEADVGEGTITAAMLVTISLLTYHGCKVAGTTHPCTTAGSPSGVIITKEPLMGHLGYTKKNGEAGKETGILVHPETGTVSAEWGCEGVEQGAVVQGEVVGVFTSKLNEFREVATIAFRKGAKRGEQTPETIELLEWLPEPFFMKEIHLTALGGQAAVESEEKLRLLPEGETIEIKA